MKIKTSELFDAALDWAVAKCEGHSLPPFPGRGQTRGPKECWINVSPSSHETFSPSTDWGRGGPIKTRERISTQIKHDGWWVACIYNMNDDPTYVQLAHSELVAAMRCLVASKLGDEVDVPEDLT